MLTTDPSPTSPRDQASASPTPPSPGTAPLSNRPPSSGLLPTCPPQCHPPGQTSRSPRAPRQACRHQPTRSPLPGHRLPGPQDPPHPAAHSLQWPGRPDPTASALAPHCCQDRPRPRGAPHGSSLPSLPDPAPASAQTWAELTPATRPWHMPLSRNVLPPRLCPAAPPRPATSARRSPHSWDVSITTGPRHPPCLDRVWGVRGCRLGQDR